MSNEQKQIDWSRPVQTRDGRKVRVLCTDGQNERRPVVGFVNGYVEPSTWEYCGTFSDHSDSLDLINTPERVERWMNVYSQTTGSFHDTHEKATNGSDPESLGVIRITYEDGKPVAVALESA